MATAPTYNTITTVPPSDEVLGRPQFVDFIQSALEFKANADWKGNKRFFITLFPNSSSIDVLERRSVVEKVIRTKITGSFINSEGAIISNNLAELSTGEITSVDTTNNKLQLGQINNLRQDYVTGSSTPPIFTSGSYLISRLNDDNPSLLIELNKEQQLPDNTGDKEFIILPANIHPFIKDNLEYFLTRAGVNVSGDTSPFITLNNSHRNLP